ncbi:MAG: toll/interleukin-1 receptor domain-containing protein [Gemmataceae bacterium]
MGQSYFVRVGKKVHAPLTLERIRQLRDAGKLPSSAEFSSDQQAWSSSLPTEGELVATPPAPPRAAIADRYDVFVSYCREDGATIARLIADKITAEGYRVFLDVQELGSGSWSQELEMRISECPDFVVVLTATYLARLRSEGSVIHGEVAAALKRGRNIVPVLVATMPPADQLPSSVAALADANGIRFVHEYADAVMIKLCALLQSARLTGPERLRTGEAEPRVIVGCIAMLLGAIQGVWIVGYADRLGWNPLTATLFGLINGLLAVAGLLLPVGLCLAGVGYVKNIRRDRLYLGPWLPFWVLFLTVLMVMTALLATAVIPLLNSWRSFWCGVTGMAVAVALTALFSVTNAWGAIRNAIGLGRR